MNTLFKLLSQPSTYAGFAGLATTYGVSTGTFSAWVAGAATLCSLIAVVLSEGQSHA